MTDLHALPPDWVTLHATTEDGLPVTVLVDRAMATAGPSEAHPLQVAVGAGYPATVDGLPTDADLPVLRALEQRLVDAAGRQGRLCAVMTVENLREWVFYASAADWAQPFTGEGLSVVSEDDPSWTGLAELSGPVG